MPKVELAIVTSRLPLLWQTEDDARVVGWVNAKRADPPKGRVAVAAGYANRKPAGKPFRLAFDEEVARLETFLAADVANDDAEP